MDKIGVFHPLGRFYILKIYMLAFWRTRKSPIFVNKVALFDVPLLTSSLLEIKNTFFNFALLLEGSLHAFPGHHLPKSFNKICNGYLATSFLAMIVI